MDLKKVRKQILKNDEIALQSLLDNYEGLIRTYTRRYYSRFEDKDDIRQILGIAIWQGVLKNKNDISGNIISSMYNEMKKVKSRNTAKMRGGEDTARMINSSTMCIDDLLFLMNAPDYRRGEKFRRGLAEMFWEIRKKLNKCHKLVWVAISRGAATNGAISKEVSKILRRKKRYFKSMGNKKEANKIKVTTYSEASISFFLKGRSIKRKDQVFYERGLKDYIMDYLKKENLTLDEIGEYSF